MLEHAMTNDELDAIEAEYEKFVAHCTPARALSQVPVLVDEVRRLWAIQVYEQRVREIMAGEDNG